METSSPEYEMRPLSKDLRMYAGLLWHWAWLIALAGILAGLAAFFISRSMTPIYEAETTVLVDQSSSTSNEYQSILMSERLTQTYADLLTQRPVLEGMMEELDLEMEIKDLREKITVQPVRDTQLIDVKVEDESPTRAAQMANTLVEVFTEQNDQRQSARYAESKDSLEAQMERVDQKIEETNQALEELEEKDGSEAERNRLELTLSQYQNTYSSLLQSYEEVRRTEAESVSNLVQVEPATPPSDPVRPRTLVNTALAGVVGGMLAVGGVFLIDALDDTIKDPERLEELIGIPILGMLPQHPEEEEDIIAIEHPRHPAVEAFRSLRTNIKYTSVDDPVRTILVTSPDPKVGKTSVVSNLAVVLAQGGSKVLLIDGDLRKPKMHRRLGVGNHKGFSDIFLQETFDLEDLIQQEEKMENLSILTSGSIPPNPAELLGSEKMNRILADLELTYDFILLDSPPLMAVTDAAILSQAVDGVLVVAKPGKTEVGALENAVEQLRRVHAKILGLVLNEIPQRGSRYYYQGYQYYEYEDYQGEDLA